MLNTIPAEIKINGVLISANTVDFKNQKQAWKYDTESSELKVKVEAIRGVSEYVVGLIGIASNTITLLPGKTIAYIAQPQLPKIVSIEPWNKSVDIVFDKEDKLGERDVIGYGLGESETATNRCDLNFGNKVTISGLSNNRKYFFRVWAENQYYRSLETDWYLFVPTSEKKPVTSYSGKGVFIQSNHFTEKEVNDDEIKTYRFDVESNSPTAVKIWIELNKHQTHHDYNKWYEVREKQLQIKDSISIEVPVQHTLERIFIAPDGETPFFKDEF